MTNDDGFVRIRINNQKDRDNIHELFTAMGCYINAVEEFNRLVINSVDADATFHYKLNGVEDGSIISKVTSVFNYIGGHFTNMVDSVALNEVSALTDTEIEITKPHEVYVLAKRLSEKIAELLVSDQLVKPYIDPVKLAKILMLISNGNEYLFEDETVELGNYGNVISINTKFRSTVPASKMTLTKKIPYKGTDKVKVIRPCNFGTSKWDLKSIVTGDSYSANFDKDCDWLIQYQNGEFSTVTARHTLIISVEYEKYVTGKDFIIKNAIIKNVKVIEDDECEQIAVFENLE
ncbi:MAG: hypothetical protein HRU40_20970 [Saprospiraceae bacterium]|nr:hypothetical protein [Saprospiraceae bacterium]